MKKKVSGIMLALLLITSLTVAFNVQPVKASGTVSGKVTELNGVTPIAGVLVEALQAGDNLVLSTTTDENGNYSLSLENGAYKLCASAGGYLSTIKPVVNVTTGTITVDFNLTRGQVLVFDEFEGTSLDNNKWDSHFTGGGYCVIYSQTDQPTKFNAVFLATNGGSAAITSKLNVALGSTIIFEGRCIAYAEGSTVYGDRQPRGLRVGTDESNAIEFRSASGYSIEARTVASGIATTTTYSLGTSVCSWNLVYRIEANSSKVNFYVNDNLIATHTTNIPTGSLNLYMGTSYPYGGNVPVGADWLYLGIKLPPEVSISPSYQSGMPGTTLNYYVAVNNTENISDNFNLTVSDNDNWSPTISPTSFTVAPGENRIAMLRVTVPSSAIGGTLDNIMVTVTSQADNTMSDSASCTASPISRSINLVSGWNLVSFPLTSASTTPHNVFPGLTYLDNFRLIYWVAPGGPYKTLGEYTGLLDNTGYWVWIDENYTVTCP